MDPPPPTTAKLRVMCSYGGHIIPFPKTNALFYSGGDTRIVSLPPITTLSALTSHLSTSLNISTPSTLKYQLPKHHLDSLITLSTDDDFFIMLDEYSRLSPAPTRIRLFVFSCGDTKLMMHPKSDSWFVDALKNVKIGGEGNAESLVLETTSSFGSTSSSASSSNFPVKTYSDDVTSAAYLQDGLPVKSLASDQSVPIAVSHPQMVTYQEKGSDSVAVMGNKVSGYDLVESETRIADVASEVEMNKIGQPSGFPFSLQYDQSQEIQFVHAGGAPVHYVSHNPTGTMPASSYYVMHPPVPQPQLYYQANQPQPIYLIPAAQSYGFPVQSGVTNNPAAVSSGHPPLHPNTLSSLARVAYKATSASPMPESSQIYRTVHMETPVIDVSHKENNQYSGGVMLMNHQTKPFGITSTESADCGNELDDSLRAQIYKSQPPAPILPSQYQTMTNATSVLLSGAFTQLHADNIQHS